MTTASSDHWVITASGRLFARLWTPIGLDSSAQAIVLLHDSLGCVELWRDFPERLCGLTGRAVLAYDRLGFGRSDPHPEALKTDFLHEEAKSGLSPVREQLGISEMILVGHSVGGVMAVACGGIFSRETSAVITMSAPAFVDDRSVAAISASKAGFASPDQLGRLMRYHGEKAKWVLDSWTETWLGSAFQDWTLDDDLHRLMAPILVLHGDRDEYASERHPERIVDLAAGPSRKVIIEDCGHFPLREKPDLVLECVARFVEQFRWTSLPAAVPGA